MNPTINADALAHFMRGLFRDEITEEHALVASMKAVDVAPFQHELDQATHKHTVTFARASGIGRDHLAPGAAVGVDPRFPRHEQLLAHPQRRGLFFAGTLAALVAGGAAAMILAKPQPHAGADDGRRRRLRPTAGVGAAGGDPAARRRRRRRWCCRRRRATCCRRDTPRAITRRSTRSSPAAVKSAALQKSRSPEQVQAKFRSLKREYAAFKSQYGPVLEDKWNAIASEITLRQGGQVRQVGCDARCASPRDGEGARGRLNRLARLRPTS